MNHVQLAAPVVRLGDSSLPVPLPAGHIGPVTLPGTNRHVWWTGRVAIGLRYERGAERHPAGQNAEWLQDLMLAHRRAHRVG